MVFLVSMALLDWNWLVGSKTLYRGMLEAEGRVESSLINQDRQGISLATAWCQGCLYYFNIYRQLGNILQNMFRVIIDFKEYVECIM